ncbi:MAG: glycine cleavage system protein H, partial [Thermoplasmata archaeon]
PSDGSVSAVTEELRKHPELINQDPYGRGWIFRWAPTGPPREFLAAAEYAGLIAAGAP